MTSKYLDAWELAEKLKISHPTLMRRLKGEPWMLPPLAHVGMAEMLRWRMTDVDRWLAETGKR